MTPGVLILLPITLSIVLLMSGYLKLSRTDETLASMAAFRLPAVLQKRWIALCVPFAELAIAVGLLVLPGIGFLLAAWAYAALMLAFTIVVSMALRRGEEVDCNCFGAVSAAPVSRWTLVRNVLLFFGAVATALGLAGTDGVVVDVVDFDSDDLVWFVVATLLITGVLVLPALRPHGGVRTEPAASVVETAVELDAQTALKPIPIAELVDARGNARMISTLVTDRPTIIVFVTTHCGPCGEINAQFPDWLRILGDGANVYVATSSAPDEIATDYPNLFPHALYGVLGSYFALGLAGFPTAIVLGTDGTIVANPQYGVSYIGGLFSDFATRRD